MFVPGGVLGKEVLPAGKGKEAQPGRLVEAPGLCAQEEPIQEGYRTCLLAPVGRWSFGCGVHPPTDVALEGTAGQGDESAPGRGVQAVVLKEGDGDAARPWRSAVGSLGRRWRTA